MPRVACRTHSSILCSQKANTLPRNLSFHWHEKLARIGTTETHPGFVDPQTWSVLGWPLGGNTTPTAGSTRCAPLSPKVHRRPLFENPARTCFTWFEPDGNDSVPVFISVDQMHPTIPSTTEWRPRTGQRHSRHRMGHSTEKLPIVFRGLLQLLDGRR